MTPDVDAFMDLALAQARVGGAAGEVPIGAVLLDSSHGVIASGFSHPISASDPTAHAEIVVLRAAAKQIGNYRLPGTTLIVTVEPCLMCAGALVHARVSKVIFGAREPKWGAFGSRVQLGGLGLNHEIEVIGGVREEECGNLMRDFFRARRE